MRFLLFILAVVWAGNAAAGTLVFLAPGEADGLALSVYPADDPRGVPVANVLAGKATQLTAGRFVYGIDSYAWRGTPFEIGESGTREIQLGGFRLGGPDGASGRFGLFDMVNGRLLAPLSVPATVFVPAGRYLLRRDLAEFTLPVQIRSGEISTLALGALSLDGPGLPKGTVAYLAESETRKIAATVASTGAALALPAGRYLIASSTGAPPAELEIIAGETTVLPAPVLHWADAQTGGPGLTLTGPHSGMELKFKTGQPVTLVAFGLREAEIRRAGESLGKLPLQSDTVSVFWRLKDGRLPVFEGLPLDLAGDGPRVVARGTTVRLVSQVPETATMQFSLRQGERTVELGQYRLGPGHGHADVPIPDDLADTPPVSFTIAGPGGLAMTGQTDPVQVHRLLSVSIQNLKISGTGATTVDLQWSSAANSGIAGVNVYRGKDTRPVNGRRPVKTGNFADIGLSAGKKYAYRVCPVDALGFSGPCTTVEARTKAPD